MKDTAFYVPREKLARLAPVYAGDPATHRFAKVKTSPNPIGLPLVPPTAPPRLDAGGAGLFSTLMDYARFAQMLGNGGALDGVRILAPATVEMMRTNMISWKALEAGISRPPVHFDTAIGFGLDAQVMLDPRAAGSLVGKNTMSWHGAFAGWWWVDPTNDIVCVGMAQRSGIYPDYVFDDIDQVQSWPIRRWSIRNADVPPRQGSPCDDDQRVFRYSIMALRSSGCRKRPMTPGPGVSENACPILRLPGLDVSKRVRPGAASVFSPSFTGSNSRSPV
jgi:CubicO group peptidase (beta-lactamase class C family)